jgi:hypothetical protein
MQTSYRFWLAAIPLVAMARAALPSHAAPDSMGRRFLPTSTRLRRTWGLHVPALRIARALNEAGKHHVLAQTFHRSVDNERRDERRAVMNGLVLTVSRNQAD